jgi:mono/diheme cytochrome c family protein
MKSVAIGLVVVALLTGCERMPNDMSEQARHNAADTSPFFENRQSDRKPADGALAHSIGDIAMTSSGRAGLIAEVQATSASPDDVQLARGHARYAIYCLPCHGEQGKGDGEVVRRGFPAPASFASVALREAPDARLHDVILHGTGAMYPFADRVSADDAWAIVAYVRALQREGSADVGAVNMGDGAMRAQPAPAARSIASEAKR